MAVADTARLIASLELKNKFSPGLKQIGNDLNKVDSRFGRVARGAGQVHAGLAKAGARIGLIAGAGLAASAKAAIDWEDAFQGVVKTVNASDAELDKLAMSLRDMSTVMPTTAIDLAHIAEAAGQMGIKVGDIEEFTRQVAILSETTNVSAEDAATALGQMANLIGLTGDEFDNFAASLVFLGNAGTSTESQILEIARRSGAVAKQIGIAKDETLGWAAAAANLGIGQELAGTSLQKFFLLANRAVGTGGEKLKVLAETAGTTQKGFRNLFNRNSTKALQTFITGLGKLDKFKRQKAIESVFGTTSGLTRLLVGLSGDIDGVNKALDDGRKSWFESNAAQKEFEKRNATVKSAIARLKNGVIDAAVTIGEGFTPALGRAADKLATFLRQDKNRSALKSLGEDIGKSIDSIDWNQVLTGARSLVDALKPALTVVLGIFNALNALPTEIKGAGLGLIGLNKLSGGLLGAGAGNIIGGLGEVLAKSLASNIPVFGKAFVQPVFVTNMGAGGLGGAAGAAGGLGMGGKLLATGAIVGSVVAVATTWLEQNAQSSQMGHDLKNTLDKDITLKTPAELTTALAGVRQGIADLTSNPLNMIVSGDALQSLKNMEASLVAEKNSRAGSDTAVLPGNKEALVSVFDKSKMATKQSVDESKVVVAGEIAASKTAITTAEAATRFAAANAGNVVAASVRTYMGSAADRIVGAIFAARPIIQPTNVNQTTTVNNRYGPSGGSDNTQRTGDTPGHPGGGGP